MKLKGKTALVTGAAGGIGRSHALRLARLGADVVVNDLDLQAYKRYGEKITADSVEEEVRGLGVRCLGIEADVCKKDQVEEMVRRILKEFGHLDILINNAGGLVGEVSQSFASSVSEEDLRATLDRNLMGTIFCCQAVAEPMKSQRWGRIVNTSSQAALQTMVGRKLRFLCRGQGRGRCLHTLSGAGAGPIRHHCQLHLSGLRQHRSSRKDRLFPSRKERAVSVSNPPGEDGCPGRHFQGGGVLRHRSGGLRHGAVLEHLRRRDQILTGSSQKLNGII